MSGQLHKVFCQKRQSAVLPDIHAEVAGMKNSDFSEISFYILFVLKKNKFLGLMVARSAFQT